MRAAINACSVCGMRLSGSFPAPLSTSMRMVSSTNSGFPSVRSRASFDGVGMVSPEAPASWASNFSTRSSLSSSDSGSSSIEVERTRPPPQPGRCSRSSGRARQMMRSGARTQSAMCSISSSSGSSAQWMSSKKRTSGCTSASVTMTSRAAHAISCELRSPSSASSIPAARAQNVGDRLLLAALAELRERLLERVVVGDARSRLDHLRQRPVGDALAVWKAAAAQDARALEPVDELPREAALPHSRLAEDREQVGTAVANRARERVLE